MELPRLEPVQGSEHSEYEVQLPYMDPVSLHYFYQAQHTMLYLEERGAYQAAQSSTLVSSPIFVA